MCPPVLAIAGAAIAAAGTLYAGAAAEAQGKYEQRVANMNSEAEKAKVADAVARGKIDQMRRYRLLSQSLGQQRAAGAANGLDVSFGSPLDMQLDAAMIAGEDVNIIGQNTTREIEGYDISAANYRSQGRAARSRGNAAFVGSISSAGSTLLGGAQQFKTLSSSAKGA